MKLCFSLLALLLLSACGGGGSGGGSNPVPTTTYANTASTYYLPVLAGNTWVYNTGARLNDQGQSTLLCGCVINDIPAEALDIINPAGTYTGTFYFSQVTSSQTGGILTTVVGTSNDHGVTVTFITDGVTYGLPVMDSKAFVGESWAYTDERSTITAIGDTQVYAGPYSLIKNVNTDAFTGTLNVNWKFAQGVGITSISLNGQAATLTSFHVDALNSLSKRANPTARMTGTEPMSRALSLLKAIF